MNSIRYNCKDNCTFYKMCGTIFKSVINSKLCGIFQKNINTLRKEKFKLLEQMEEKFNLKLNSNY